MRNLQGNKMSQLNLQTADKGSAVVIWDRNDYLKEAEKQLSDRSTNTEIKVIKRFSRFS